MKIHKTISMVNENDNNELLGSKQKWLNKTLPADLDEICEVES